VNAELCRQLRLVIEDRSGVFCVSGKIIIDREAVTLALSLQFVQSSKVPVLEVLHLVNRLNDVVELELGAFRPQNLGLHGSQVDSRRETPMRLSRVSDRGRQIGSSQGRD